MAKTIVKRTLSMFLAMVFIFTTFCFADIVLFASARKSLDPVNKELEPEIHLYMPEAIYLDPSDTTSKYDFMYFVDTTSDGTPNANSSSQLSGLIYFDCTSECSRIELQYDTSVVELSTSASSVVAPAAVTNARVAQWTINGGSTSVRRGAVPITVKYRLVGESYDRYLTRNIYMYGMRMNATLAAGSAFRYDSYFVVDLDDPQVAGFFAIAGLHRVGGGYHTIWDQAPLYNGNTITNGSRVSILARTWDTPTIADVGGEDSAMDPNEYGWIQTQYSNEEGDGFESDGATTVADTNVYGGGFRWFAKTKESPSSNTKSYDCTTTKPGGSGNINGYITVDASRHSNYSMVPFMENASIVAGAFHCYPDLDYEMYGTADGNSSQTITALEHATIWMPKDGYTSGIVNTQHMSGAVPAVAQNTVQTVTPYTLTGSYDTQRPGTWGMGEQKLHLHLNLHLIVTSVDKGALRNKVNEAYSKAWTAEDAGSDKMNLNAGDITT